jgi:3-oxoadipate enol-lactonase
MTATDDRDPAEEHLGLSYADSCPDTVLLLIHGFPLNNHIWDGQIGGLSDVARVIAPDLRGFGASDATEGDYSMAMLADDCITLLDELGIDQAVVGGHSMGGYVALELYRRYPERVQGLVLIATRAGADSAEARAGRDASAATVRSEGTGPLAAGMREKLFAPATIEEEPDLVEWVDHIMASAEPVGVVGALAAMRDRVDSTPHLTEIEVPTLIVHGADDRLIPPSEAEAMHQAIPGSRLELIHGAGHLPNLEQEEEFNERLAEFLSRFDAE